MLINSLAAITLGYVLDMIFGDPKALIYPLNLMKIFVEKFKRIFRTIYATNVEAQTVAGTALLFTCAVIVGGGCGVLLFVCYKLSLLLGIFVEGIMCWSAISVRKINFSALEVMRKVKNHDLDGAKQKFVYLSQKNTKSMDLNDITKATVEYVAESISTKAVIPIFWMLIGGGTAGLLYRCINVMYDSFGRQTKYGSTLGKAVSAAQDFFGFIPSRFAALFLRFNCNFLKLDSKNAAVVYKRDRKNCRDANSGQTLSVCAGALDIFLGGNETRGNIVIRRPYYGNDYRPVNYMDIYWACQLFSGTVFLSVFFTAVIRTALFFIF